MRLPIGTTVRRDCLGCIGDGSIGIITAHGIDSKCYWVAIINGKGAMDGWETDAWAQDWCVPIDFNNEPTWEV
jgi:hypothetical protein